MAKLVRFDWAIKYLLRNKVNFDILEGFLSELLKTDIKIETLLESESNKETWSDKSNRVDLLVQTSQGERILIEVQCSTQWDYLSRILYGTSKVVTEYIRQGDAYKNICKVISVSIVFFNLGEGKDYLYKGTTSFEGLHYHDTLRLGPEEMKIYGQGKTPSDVLSEYYIIKVNQFRESIKDKLDQWIYFLKNEQIKNDFNAKGIQSAAHKLDVLRLNDDERRAYENFQKDLHQDASMALPYEVGKEEGMVEGRAEGRAEGIKEERAATLIRLLTRKFGVLPAEHHQRIQRADAELLLTWSELILEAKTLDDVFQS
jgi:predicted transposase/invertase (TIGR01784 family)